MKLNLLQVEFKLLTVLFFDRLQQHTDKPRSNRSNRRKTAYDQGRNARYQTTAQIGYQDRKEQSRGKHGKNTCKNTKEQHGFVILKESEDASEYLHTVRIGVQL